MSRSTKKGPYVDEKLLKKVQSAKSGKGHQAIKTWARASTITPDFVGMIIQVHNGRKHLPIRITEHMVGHKLGEFAPTRFFRTHGAAHTKEATSLT